MESIGRTGTLVDVVINGLTANRGYWGGSVHAAPNYQRFLRGRPDVLLSCGSRRRGPSRWPVAILVRVTTRDSYMRFDYHPGVGIATTSELKPPILIFELDSILTPL